jgi:hypothetical protein
MVVIVFKLVKGEFDESGHSQSHNDSCHNCSFHNWYCYSFIVSKLYKMHDVRNEDGQYAWIVPSKLFELQSKINASQEMIAESLKSVSEHNAEIAKLMQTLVDSTLVMHQSIVNQNS